MRSGHCVPTRVPTQCAHPTAPRRRPYVAHPHTHRCSRRLHELRKQSTRTMNRSEQKRHGARNTAASRPSLQSPPADCPAPTGSREVPTGSREVPTAMRPSRTRGIPRVPSYCFMASVAASVASSSARNCAVNCASSSSSSHPSCQSVGSSASSSVVAHSCCSNSSNSSSSYSVWRGS